MIDENPVGSVISTHRHITVCKLDFPPPINIDESRSYHILDVDEINSLSLKYGESQFCV